MSYCTRCTTSYSGCDFRSANGVLALVLEDLNYMRDGVCRFLCLTGYWLCLPLMESGLTKYAAATYTKALQNATNSKEKAVSARYEPSANATNSKEKAVSARYEPSEEASSCI